MNLNIKTIHLLSRILLVIYLVTLAYLCFGSFEHLPDVQKSILGIPTDKVVHFFMFLPFPIIAFLAFDKFTDTARAAVLAAVLTFAAGLVLAAATEYIQGLTPHRSKDAMDFLADALGLLTGSVTVLIIDLAKITK